MFSRISPVKEPQNRVGTETSLDPQQLVNSLMSRSLFYNYPFLKQGTESSSSDFLKDISFEVDLKELYKPLSSCYVNAQMQYCPVVVEIKHPLLMKEYQSKYMLQVWNKAGNKVFQRKLHSELRTWSISNEYFVYKPEEGDTNSDYYHITNLNNDNSTILIKDFIQDYTFDKLLYQDGVLYIANKEIIYVINAQDRVAAGQTEILKIDPSDTQEICPGLAIQAIFNYREQVKIYQTDTGAASYRSNDQNALTAGAGGPTYINKVLVISETQDNQLDFSQLIVKNLNSDAFTFMFKQQKEVVPRDSIKLDRVQKLVYIVTEQNVFYGITLRETGRIDIYWDMTLIDSPNSMDANDVSISFDTLYFSMGDNTVKSVPIDKGSQINYEQHVTESKDFEFERIFYQNIKLNFNIYNSFTLINTTLYVAHGSFISLYNIQNKQWLKHMKFEEGEIEKMTKSMSKKIDAKEKLELVVLLKNGSIYCDIQSFFFALDESQMYISAQNRTCQVQGQILKTTIDNQNHKWLYIMTKDKDEDLIQMSVLHYGRLFTIDYGLEELIDEQSNFVPVFSKTNRTCVIWQRGSHIILYDIKIGRIREHENQQEAHDTSTLFKNMSKLNQSTLFANLKFGGLGQSQIGVEDDEEKQIILTSRLNYFAPTTIKNIHTCVSLDIFDHLIMADETNIYKYMIKTNNFQQYSRQFCVGMQIIDDKFCYSLSHQSGLKSSGLRLYDISNMITKNTDTSYMLDNVQVGFSGIIDWNKDYSRFSFLKSFNAISIVPALHRNTLAFIGMGPRETYLATKMISDKFIALDNKNQLFCWSVVTGKLLSTKKLPFLQDYSNFKVFQCDQEVNSRSGDKGSEYAREWYSQVLLTKNTKESNYDESKFFSAESIRSQIKNQETYIKGQQKEFREFKLIEIINEVEVKEHFSFIHPQFKSQHQNLYFDNKRNYMLEKLNHPSVFLFEKESIQGTNKVRWNFVKRFNKYPEDLENESGFARVMSPAFDNYIDINRGLGQFVIRDTFTDKVVQTISRDLMDPTSGDIQNIMNRFLWLENNQVRIINSEGIEKIVDIYNLSSEVEYNVIPLFNNMELIYSDSHYFTNRPELDVSEVLERLQRKYQQYKSSYYLYHRREPQTLYPQLFTVDYQIKKCKGMHVSDLSFTFLHWKLMEQIEQGILSIDLIDDAQIELMCYNIIPGGNTVLHKVIERGDTISKILKIAHPNEERVSEMVFHVPFIPNFSQKSPMHLSMELQDLRTMDIMLKYLGAYEIDHHSRTIADTIPFIIEKGLPSLAVYLDSRMYQTNQAKSITKGCINPSAGGLKESMLWFDIQDFKSQLLLVNSEQVHNSKEGQEDDTAAIQVERPIKIEFIDLPFIYNYQDPLCDKFFGGLANTDQYQIFQRKGIQKVIEFNYPLVKEYTIKKLFIPFMTFQASLFFYLNFIFQINHPILSKLDFPMQVILGFYACYFLKNEIVQIRNEGVNYFTSIWNYVDVITPSTILSVLTINAFQIPISKEIERVIQAIGVFFMWFKFLYFFRIFKSYAYLTRLLIVVILDMKDFLVVLFITIVAFSDSLLTISLGNPEKEQFVSNFTDAIIYTYRLVLGDFDVTQFGSVATTLVYALFIMCTLFNTIVMLNLLIAIISETFASVKENSENASYQEMAAMIAENSYLIPDHRKEKYAIDNRFIIVVTDMDSEMNQEEDVIGQKLELLKKNLLARLEAASIAIQEIKEIIIKQIQSAERQEKQSEIIITMLSQIPGVSTNYSPPQRRETSVIKKDKYFSIKQIVTHARNASNLVVNQDIGVRYTTE